MVYESGIKILLFDFMLIVLLCVDSSIPHQMAFFDVQFNTPSVVLDHYAPLSVSYVPGKNTLSMTFTCQDGYNKARTTWPSNAGLVLVTHTPGCGNYAGGERCYFQVSALNFLPNSYTVVAIGASNPLENALNNAIVEWGTYWPGENESPSSGNQTPSSGVNATGNSTCGSPDAKYGLPTASLGVDFDSTLDDCLGYKNINETDFDGYVDSIGSDDEDDPELTVDTTPDLEGDTC